MKRRLFSLIILTPLCSNANETPETVLKAVLPQEKLSAVIEAFEKHKDKPEFSKQLTILRQMKGTKGMELLKLGKQLSANIQNVIKGFYAHLSYLDQAQKATAFAAA